MKKRKIVFCIMMVILTVILGSCGSKSNSTISNSKKIEKNEFQIQYLGQSAFVLTDDSGKSVGIDFYTSNAFPYAEDVPESMGNFKKGDISKLLISHSHADHSFIPAGVDALKGYDPTTDKVNDEPNFISIGQFNIGKYKSFHLSNIDMENAVFVFNVDGVKVVDLGDAFGTMADSQKLKELKDKVGNIDILMMPIGDPNCIKVDFNILQNTMNLMNPKVVIPIHYWNVADKKEFSDNSSKLGYIIKNIKENNILVSGKELSSQNRKAISSQNRKAIWNITPAKFSK